MNGPVVSSRVKNKIRRWFSAFSIVIIENRCFWQTLMKMVVLRNDGHNCKVFLVIYSNMYVNLAFLCRLMKASKPVEQLPRCMVAVKFEILLPRSTGTLL